MTQNIRIAGFRGTVCFLLQDYRAKPDICGSGSDWSHSCNKAIHLDRNFAVCVECMVRQMHTGSVCREIKCGAGGICRGVCIFRVKMSHRFPAYDSTVNLNTYCERTIPRPLSLPGPCIKMQFSDLTQIGSAVNAWILRSFSAYRKHSLHLSPEYLTEQMYWAFLNSNGGSIQIAERSGILGCTQNSGQRMEFTGFLFF